MAAAEKEVAEKTRQVEIVKMTDGRTVEFVGKRKMLKETLIENGQVGVRIDFRNGETRTFWIPSELRDRFAGHGAEQKYGDECAGIEDVDDMVLAVDDLDSRIQKLEFTKQREGGGFGGTSVLLRALVEFSGRTAEQVKEFLRDKSQAEKMALRTSAQLKPIVDRLEAEKASKAAKVDTNALFAKL